MPRRRAAAEQAGAAPRASKLFLALFAGVTWTQQAVAEAWYPSLVLSGACDAKKDMNGAIFDFQGKTASGAPYYKARTREEYIYHDPDCSDSGDGTARWILDGERPSLTAAMDLDGDSECVYHARVDSKDLSHPPISANWDMMCEAGMKSTFLILSPITTTSTSTTVSSTTTTSSTTVTKTSTTKTSTTVTSTTVTSTTTTVSSTTTTTRTKTSTTRTGTSTTVTGSSTTVTGTTTSTSLTATSTTATKSTTTLVVIVQLSGACAYKDFLNKETFVSHGYTANGAMLFKGLNSDQYMYYDLDCDGGGNGQPRWIIDYGVPNASRAEDLDGDGACNYHARLDASEMTLYPPSTATWTMYCGRGWVQQTLRFTETPTMPQVDHGDGDHAFGDEKAPVALRVEGEFCEERKLFNGMLLNKEGKTSSGAPYYKATGTDFYLYYDPDCMGNTTSRNLIGRWIVDTDVPSTTEASDLDGDGQCDYLARAESAEKLFPPDETVWRVHCGAGVWQDHWIKLVPIEPTTTTGRAAPPSGATGHGHGDEGHAGGGKQELGEGTLTAGGSASAPSAAAVVAAAAAAMFAGVPW